LAQVGPIDNSPCIFFPIDPAISLPSTITRGGCLFFNSDHKNAILLMPPIRVRHDHLPRAVSSTDKRPEPATRNSLSSIAQSLQSRSHRNPLATPVRHHTSGLFVLFPYTLRLLLKCIYSVKIGCAALLSGYRRNSSSPS
jgi:hypothetical protein